ncbi:intraflagellar transport protein 43 homolog B-like isoform X1 [Babylonia areolata]|uniref:intraflagellar transport protein 43 homolog B-like isoform X1 n=1 Tax=Babylonia areolata TaxID=304850 RepID=UPI003FD3432D
MDDDELDFGASKSRSARQGRRAAAATPAADVDPDDDDLDTGTKPASGGGPPDRPNKAVSGWGEEAPRKPRSRQLGEGFEAIEDERLRPGTPAKDDSDSDNDIPVIPELDDQVEEDMSTRVAAAPNVAVNRVATYRELDNDLLRQAAFQVLDNEIDLKLLTKSLSPMEDLIEEDRLWDWDRLFTEVSSELTTQWEKNIEDGEKEKEQAET